ncbi:MAG: restriction endonuclease [Devosia nanyangense]|uniref:Restriction endonuclease n=1 Tax=Devosia nanyangense TaxID=1228055 RepID=A0A933L4M1_9HYPH|nr:restriction endonuclease [Devosia nanyangense]
MARRIGFEQVLRASVREFSRQQRLSAQRAKAAEREANALVRQRQREATQTSRRFALNAKEQEKLDKLRYLETREQEVEAKNAALELRVEALSGVLEQTLLVDDAIDFNGLRINGAFEEQLLPSSLKTPEPQPDIRRHLAGLRQPSGIAKLFPWVRKAFERRLARAKDFARQELIDWQAREAERQAKLAELGIENTRRHHEFLGAQSARNAEVDGFEADCREADPEALVAYFSMVLERSEYPEGFPQNFSVALQQASRLLVVRYELPPPSIVPDVDEFRYVKTRDVIEGKPRKATDQKLLYSDAIAAVVLRTVHEIFESDVWGHVDVVAVNGMVKAVDAATGQDIEPCLVSVRTTREAFEVIDLRRINKAVCLRNLGAQVSRNPEEVQPVKPIVEFKMTDPRFVDQSDLVSELSSATNLMDLNPYEFEELVANLFGKMGLESKLTRASRDGGVDCVAFDPRPVLGGKVVIQAKRYRHVVGVSAVRDLYGTMMNEGASKGLLVTTSGYGPDAFQFAKDKPIELIDGGGLLYLLGEIGVEARIVMPTE